MLFARVLVLNQSYEPIHFTTIRRAVVLVLNGKADYVESTQGWLRSARLSMPRPSVVRLNRYIRRPYRVSVSFSKRNVFRRDNHTCQYCGSQGPNLTLDHIVPRSQRGSTCWENVVVACQPCNLRKGNRSLAASNLTLSRRPVRPHYFWYQLMAHAPNRTQLESWKKYIPSRWRFAEQPA